MSFFHGVETIELNTGNRPITATRSGVIGLIGIAPSGATNELTLVKNPVDAAAFGPELAGFNIPKALADIYKQGSATVLVVNIFDEDSHTTAVTAESHDITNGVASLDNHPVDEPVIDVTGVAEVLSTAIVEITGGTVGGSNEVVSVVANGVTIASNVAFDTDDATTASAVESAIDAGTGTHGYSAATVGAVVTISSPVGSGAGANGNTLAVTVGGDVTVDAQTTFTGGVTEITAISGAVKDQDYSIDNFGNIRVLDFNKIPEGAEITVDYKYLDESAITNSLLIGEIDGTTNARTGSKLYDLAYNLFGFDAKIYIAPGYSTTDAIADMLDGLAEKFRGVSLIDAPSGTTYAEALAGRGPLGAINFQRSDKRSNLLWPHLKRYDLATNANELAPFSQFMAGVMAANDNNNGYWFSPSNKEIAGVAGIEKEVQFKINDETCEANALNAAGIITAVSTFGTGLRTWGNRSSAFPVSTDPKEVFINVRRTADVIHTSVEYAMLQFIDQPLNQGTIDAVRGTVNAFLKTLYLRGAILDGFECTYDPAKNPAEQLAAGHVVFDITYMVPTPAERITFESFIDINLLQQLV